MPGSRHSELKGNLYIVFDVEFPENSFLEEKDLQVSPSSPVPSLSILCAVEEKKQLLCEKMLSNGARE